MSKYAIETRFHNPRLNEKMECTSKREAIRLARRWAAEVNSTATTTISRNGQAIGFRDHNRSRITWM